MFGTWLKEQRKQDRENGVEFRDLACHPDQLSAYVREHLHNIAQCAHWMKVRTPDPSGDVTGQREFWEGGRESFIAVMTQAARNAGQALNAVGCTDEEFARAYAQATAATLPSQQTEPVSPSAPPADTEETDGEKEEEKTEPVKEASVTQTVVVRSLHERRALKSGVTPQDTDNPTGEEELSS